MSQRWNQFFCHLQKDLKMWLFFMLVLTLNRDVFNQVLFKAGEDDMSAILSTLYADYHPFRYLLLAAALIASGLWICRRRWFAREFVAASISHGESSS